MLHGQCDKIAKGQLLLVKKPMSLIMQLSEANPQDNSKKSFVFMHHSNSDVLFSRDAEIA